MPICCVFNCKSKELKGVKFYPFVKSQKEKDQTKNNLRQIRFTKWCEALKVDPSKKKVKYACICSLHFKSGRPSKLMEVNSPDWVPSLNLHQNSQAGKDIKRKQQFQKVSGKGKAVIELAVSDESEELSDSDETDSNWSDLPDSSDEVASIKSGTEELVETEYLETEFVEEESEIVFEDEMEGPEIDKEVEYFEEVEDQEETGDEEEEEIEEEKAERNLEMELIEASKSSERHQHIIEKTAGPNVIVRPLESGEPPRKIQRHLGEVRIVQRQVHPQQNQHLVQQQTVQSSPEKSLANIKDTKSQMMSLQKEISRVRLCQNTILTDLPRCLLYTGLNNGVCSMVFSKIQNQMTDNKTGDRYGPWEIFIITLYKCRMDHTFEFISDQFNLDQQKLTSLFFGCITELHRQFSSYIVWPDRSSNIRGKPELLKAIFETNFTMIVDCIELPTEMAGHPVHLKMKNKKFLVGISTTGFVCFVSSSFPTSVNNLDMLFQSGFLDKLQEDDVLLGREQFFENNKINSSDIVCYQKEGRHEISVVSIEDPKLKTSVDMLVQRQINTVRRKYEILGGRQTIVVPKGCIEYMVDQTVEVCCSLYNLGQINAVSRK